MPRLPPLWLPAPLPRRVDRAAAWCFCRTEWSCPRALLESLRHERSRLSFHWAHLMTRSLPWHAYTMICLQSHEDEATGSGEKESPNRGGGGQLVCRRKVGSRKSGLPDGSRVSDHIATTAYHSESSGWAPTAHPSKRSATGLQLVHIAKQATSSREACVTGGRAATGGNFEGRPGGHDTASGCKGGCGLLRG
jgi:hypothetical protein